jgi:hypothetical protein
MPASPETTQAQAPESAQALADRDWLDEVTKTISSLLAAEE